MFLAVTNKLTAFSTILLHKLTDNQLVKDFLPSYVVGIFTAVFKGNLHSDLS